MENKLIENLVNETFSSESAKCEWAFHYIEELNCYWQKEKNWFFPVEVFEKYLSTENTVNADLRLDDILEVHKSAKFKVKKNEGENTLILYLEKSEESNSEQAA